mmetsp:Transcript_35824/g.94098  ORF Transcript_35824/g.94098 Transcript_35824/m.94098 type:complete len:383 (-) Transcript_35824:305-1453(-)
MWLQLEPAEWSRLELGLVSSLRVLTLLLILPRGELVARVVLEVVAPLLDDLNHVFVAERVGEADTLRRVLDTLAPHHRVIERHQQRAVDLLACGLDRRTVAVVCQHHGIFEVGLLATWLRVDADEAEGLPDLVGEDVRVEAHLATEHHRVRLRRNPLAVLDRAHVNLVVHVETLDVLPVALDQVDELVDGAVLTKQDLGRVDLVLVQQLAHVQLRDATQLARRRDRNSAILLPLKVHIRWPLVQSQADHLELTLEELALALGLATAHVDHQQDQVARPRYADDLPATALALGGTLDDTGKVEQLDASVPVVDDAWDARQRGELVGGRLRFGRRECAEDSRLAHGRETDECHPSIAHLFDIEASALTGLASLGWRDELRSVLG